MATGVIIKDAQGNTKQVPFDQLQQADPYLYSQYVKNIAQPQAQLQETQASTGAAGASAAASSASAQKSQIDLNQNQAFGIIQKLFDANKGKDNKVSPQTYNAAKSTASGLGIDGGAFDSKFETSYTNPDNHYYDTPNDQAILEQFDQTKRQIQTNIDAYNSIPDDQKGVVSKSVFTKNPALGQLFAPQAAEYESQRTGLSAQLEQIVGAGAGSGIKVSQTELNNWTNLLPSPTKSQQANEYDLKQLDNQLKAKFNLGKGLDPQYVPGSKQAQQPGAAIQRAQQSSKTMKIGNYNVEVQP